MNPRLQPLVKSVKALPITDQLEFICEISKSLSMYYKPLQPDNFVNPLQSYDIWLDELTNLYQVETSEEILEKRIEDERNSWD